MFSALGVGGAGRVPAPRLDVDESLLAAEPKGLVHVRVRFQYHAMTQAVAAVCLRCRRAEAHDQVHTEPFDVVIPADVEIYVAAGMTEWLVRGLPGGRRPLVNRPEGDAVYASHKLAVPAVVREYRVGVHVVFSVH